MFRLDRRGRIPAIVLSGGLAATLGLAAAPPAQAAPALGTVTFAAGRGALSVIGTRAADLLMQRLADPDGERLTLRLPPTLRLRNSCGCG